ncbi:MFS transporter [Streptomyces sp. NPDC048389]|uniref:MFS transporter n=1 Tax=Streptomyces sp. NPDC048389 TaxID=3154622 RepID=UPI0034549C17
MVAFCATLPVVVSAVIGGPVIDRIGRRRVSIATDLVCAVALAAIPLLHCTGALRFWMLCALMAVTGLFHAPGETARYVLVPDLAELAGTRLSRAASLFDAVSRGARMTGAALAGVLIALIGAEAVVLRDAATFCGSALLIALGLRRVGAAEPRRARAPVSFAAYRGELREGYAFLLRARLLLGVVLMVMVTNGPDQGWSSVLLPVHAKDNLGGARDLGLLAAVFGGCAPLGALLYAAVGHRFRRRPGGRPPDRTGRPGDGAAHTGRAVLPDDAAPAVFPRWREMDAGRGPLEEDPSRVSSPGPSRPAPASAATPPRP